MRHLLITSLLLVFGFCGTLAQTRTTIDKDRFANPTNEDKIYMLQHSTQGDVDVILNKLQAAGFGGIVTNAEWHNGQSDKNFYLENDTDFAHLDEVIKKVKKRGMGLWLYDECGYPSASANGLTLLGHPEYEARGFIELRAEGKGTVWNRPNLFEKIIFACRDDGSPVPFNADRAEGADKVYVVRPVFEGSHAQNCGWGPRHYPNLMDKKAVAAFIRCTYDRYFEKTKGFGEFEAVFTDEPSLMSGYVNCGVPMPWTCLPWTEELPEKYLKMHGRELWEDIPVLFSREERFYEGKVRFWKTVSQLVNEAYFDQIEKWCAAHGIAFSGHCLLEEGLAMHTPLYGNLIQQLKTFDYPGVDMLTGDVEAYKFSDTDYALAPRYVGGAARMTGKTDRVMVEICPIVTGDRKEDFTFAEERGTMDLIFRAGINHINSYLTADRLGEDFPHYSEIFGRCAYMLRGSRWTGRIGMYYPIETAQGYYCPEKIGVNNGAKLSDAETLVEKTLRTLNRQIASAGLDWTFIDSDWIGDAALDGGSLSANGLEVDAILMPAVRWIDDKTREKLRAFEKAGGLLIWVGAKPEGEDSPLCEDPVRALKTKVDYGLKVKAEHPESLFVGLYEKNGKRMWYVINSSPAENKVKIAPGGPVQVWNTFNGEVGKKTTFVMPPYSSAFVTEGKEVIGDANPGILAYKDSSKPVDERVKDLVSRMTLKEKLRQLNQLDCGAVMNGNRLDPDKLKGMIGTEGYGSIQGITIPSWESTAFFNEVQRYCVENTRLGIPIFTSTESLHGAIHDGSTVFPQSIALASTFDPTLAYNMTKAISEELISEGANQTLCPVLDVARDPRWGRTEETFGEDPFLNGTFGIAEVKGYLEGGMNPVIKHFGPGGEPVGGLNLASVDCSPRDLELIHLKPFEMVVRNTGVRGVMSSYDSWNRVPNSASKFLLTDLLRDKWGFKGYVYSDWGAVGMLHNFQRLASSYEEAARLAISAGLDFEAAGGCYQELETAVKEGRISEDIIDRTVSNVLRVKFEMGLFDNPYRNLGGKATVRTEEHVALSRRIADESIVLLKNEGNLLPLNKESLKSVAVIGPNADQVQFGDYSWSRSNEDGKTPLEALREHLDGKVKINYAKGCDLVSEDKSGFQDAVRAASSSDVSLVFLGTCSASLARDYTNSTSGEGYDLESLDLTGVQEDLLRAVAATGKPVVLVLVTGKPICIPWAKDNIPAILTQWYGGETAGDAVTDMLFGKTVPSGKLSISFPKSSGHLPAYYNHLPTDKGYYHQPGSTGKPGRDYVFSSPDPLWAFGHGLSYTEFEYGELRLSDPQTVKVEITNKGNLEGKEVVQLYVRQVNSPIVTPVKELKAFSKVTVPAGGKTEATLTFTLTEPGEYLLMVGSSSEDIRQETTVKVR